MTPTNLAEPKQHKRTRSPRDLARIMEIPDAQLSLREVEETLLGVSKVTGWQMRRRGDYPPVNRTSTNRQTVSVRDFKAWLETRRSKAA